MIAARLRFFTAVLLVSCLSLAAGAAANGEDGDEWVNKPAPAFELTDLAGNDLRLADLTGQKVVWLNFWGLRCGPCVRELPALQKLYAANKKRGLVLIAVNTDGVDAEFISKALADRPDLKAAGVTFPVAPDPEFATIDAYGLLGAPLNVMIDRGGVVRFRHEGYEEGDEVRYAAELEKLLAQ
jgi:peroxiredoxin